MERSDTRTADRLRRELEEDIATGRLLQGTKLDETALAQRFGVSRTPVREALMQLASAGLIEMRLRQGAIVAPMSVSRLIELFEVMAELEALCARLAARRMTDVEREALEETLEACRRMVDQGNFREYYETNIQFHEAIYDGSHNAYLAGQTRTLRNRLQPYRRAQLGGPGRMASSYAEHVEIVRAIVAADAIRAEGAMRRHVSIQGDMFFDLVSTLSSNSPMPESG